MSLKRSQSSATVDQVDGGHFEKVYQDDGVLLLRRTRSQSESSATVDQVDSVHPFGKSYSEIQSSAKEDEVWEKVIEEMFPEAARIQEMFPETAQKKEAGEKEQEQLEKEQAQKKEAGEKEQEKQLSLSEIVAEDVKRLLKRSYHFCEEAAEDVKKLQEEAAEKGLDKEAPENKLRKAMSWADFCRTDKVTVGACMEHVHRNLSWLSILKM